MIEKCSIIVLNYNGKQFLKECLDSLRDQTYKDYKVYVLDNASTDGSREYISQDFPWVGLIRASENFGTAEGSNVGVRNTSGEYIVLMSNDIRVDPKCIERLVSTLESDGSIGICSGMLVKYAPLISGEHLIDNAGGVIDKFGFPLLLHPDEVYRKDDSRIEEAFFSFGGGFIIRRSLFDRVGGFDPKYFTLSDDMDLSWRVRLTGHKVVVDHSAVIYHKVSATLGPLFARSQKRFWSERNSLRTLLKNYQFWTLFRILPQYLFLLLLEAGFYLAILRADLFCSLLKALVWNSVNLRDTAALRRQVTAFRSVDDRAILGKMHKGIIKLETASLLLAGKIRIQ